MVRDALLRLVGRVRTDEQGAGVNSIQDGGVERGQDVGRAGLAGATEEAQQHIAAGQRREDEARICVGRGDPVGRRVAATEAGRRLAHRRARKPTIS